MKKVIIAALALTTIGGAADARMTRGYLRKNGTYVAPSFKTTPNHTKLDNYSTKGNVNPYSGNVGTVDPYAPTRGNPLGSPINKPKFGY